MATVRGGSDPAAPLSIVIPALNEAGRLAATLAAVARLRGPFEVIISDGGSVDDTAAIAGRHGAIVVAGERGRGTQLHAGARIARGDVLWFLHADTHPPPDGVERIGEALRDPRVVAGNFEIRLDGESRAARFLTWLYPRLRRLGLRYGDSGIFVRREAYVRAGGFRPLPIFEDLDLIRRLRPLGRWAVVPAVVVTSSRNFEGRSFLLVFAGWVALQVLYWLGVPPRVLGRLYYPATHRPEARTSTPGAGTGPQLDLRASPAAPVPARSASELRPGGGGG
jgi:rSAM/selenodomain-associated transferase 2